MLNHLSSWTVDGRVECYIKNLQMESDQHLSLQDRRDILSAVSGLELNVQRYNPIPDPLNRGKHWSPSTDSNDASTSILQPNEKTYELVAIHMDSWIEHLYGVSLDHSVIRHLMLSYILNFHTVFPILDTYMVSDDPLQVAFNVMRSSKLLFTAMLFVAITYADTTHLETWPKSARSLHEAQDSLFNIAKTLYHQSQDQDQIILCQSAFLLSTWGPYNDESEKHKTWINRALLHASLVSVAESSHNVNASQARVIWACCLARERILALSAQTTCRAYAGAHRADLVTLEDFQGTSVFPPAAIDCFLLLGRLCEILSHVLSLRHRVLDCQARKTTTEVWPWSTEEILSLTGALRDWELDRSFSRQRHHDTLQTNTSATYSFLDLLRNAVSIYLHGLSIRYACDEDILSAALKVQSFREVERATINMAEQLNRLLRDSPRESIPLMIASWLPTPIFICLIKIHIDRTNEALQHLRNLLRTLHLLRSRYSGASFVTHLVDTLMRTLPAKLPCHPFRHLTEPEPQEMATITSTNNARDGGSLVEVPSPSSRAFFLHPLTPDGPNTARLSTKSQLLVWAIESVNLSFQHEHVTVI